MLGNRGNPRIDGTAWAPFRGKVLILGQAGLLGDHIRQAAEKAALWNHYCCQKSMSRNCVKVAYNSE